MIRGAVGEEQPGASQKASCLTCAHSVPHLPLPEEGLLGQAGDARKVNAACSCSALPSGLCLPQLGVLLTQWQKPVHHQHLESSPMAGAWGGRNVLAQFSSRVVAQAALSAKAVAVCCHRSSQLRGGC